MFETNEATLNSHEKNVEAASSIKKYLRSRIRLGGGIEWMAQNRNEVFWFCFYFDYEK